MSNQKRVFLALVSLLIGMGVFFANRPEPRYVSPYVPGATPPPVTELGQEPIQVTPTPAPDAPPVQANTVTYYQIVDSPDGPILRPATRELAGKKPTNEARLAAAVVAMTEGATPALPKGTTLLRLKIEGTTALLDFSKELKENFSGGDKAEQLAINALTATAGQLPRIETVQIFIDGAVVETLGGSQSLLRPLKVPQKN